MTATAVILLLISALMHAGWNLIAKRQHPGESLFLLANIIGGLCLLPVVIYYRSHLAAIPGSVWLILGATGLCMAGYYAALAGAYRHGHLSIAYPLARSSPVIVVTLSMLLLGRGDQISSQCIAGILLVVGGGVLLPMKRFGEIRLKNYLNLSCLLALVAAFGTTGYSLLDDEGLRQLREMPGGGFSPVTAALIYIFFEVVCSSVWLGLFVLVRRRGRKELLQTLRHAKRPAVLMGVGIYLAYVLVLISMAFVNNVSYVVAFRQFSIPLGAVLGVLLLSEPRCAPKFAGVAIMFIGLILVGTG